MTLRLDLVILMSVTLPILLVGIALVIAYYKLRRPDFAEYHTYMGLGFGAWFTFGAGALLLLGTIGALIPFNPTYWVLTQHTGTISTLSNRFVDGSGDLSGGTYTLTLDGDPTPLVVTDSRILGLEVGQKVDMTCSVEWVYGGADINNCYMRSF